MPGAPTIIRRDTTWKEEAEYIQFFKFLPASAFRPVPSGSGAHLFHQVLAVWYGYATQVLAHFFYKSAEALEWLYVIVQAVQRTRGYK